MPKARARTKKPKAHEQKSRKPRKKKAKGAQTKKAKRYGEKKPKAHEQKKAKGARTKKCQRRTTKKGQRRTTKKTKGARTKKGQNPKKQKSQRRTNKKSPKAHEPDSVGKAKVVPLAAQVAPLEENKQTNLQPLFGKIIFLQKMPALRCKSCCGLVVLHVPTLAIAITAHTRKQAFKKYTKQEAGLSLPWHIFFARPPRGCFFYE
jgi:hypothetical protein